MCLDLALVLSLAMNCLPTLAKSNLALFFGLDFIVPMMFLAIEDTRALFLYSQLCASDVPAELWLSRQLFSATLHLLL